MATPTGPDPTAAIPALVTMALAEDIGPGDVTSEFFIPATSRSKARILAKEDGILSGLGVFREVFRQVDAGVGLFLEKQEGQPFSSGETLLTLEGKTRSILTAERTALNFLQRLSGIATQTHRYITAMDAPSVQLLDTRKTTPGWRLLEKAAVRHGGGTNHRIGLYDRVMVKDNHHMACGRLSDLQAAIQKVKAKHPSLKIQLEAANLTQVSDILTLTGVDMILLDNMPIPQLKEAVALIGGRLFTEASGGITLTSIKKVAATGVNAISCGALTHSAKAIDLSLEID
jgi:nicotinate-nucleotide pyrophosphorylase (carboxylating)